MLKAVDRSRFDKGEGAMSARFRNRLLTVCVAVLASMLLVSVTIVLDVIAPKGTVFGWLLRTVPLILVIPAIMIGFDALCDWYYHAFIIANQETSKERNRSVSVDASYHVRPLTEQPLGIAESRTPGIAGCARFSRTNCSSAPRVVPVLQSPRPIVGQSSPKSPKRWIGQ